MRNNETIESPKEEQHLIAVMEFYEQIQHEAAPSLKFYQASLNAAQKIIDFFNDFDLAETNPRTGNPLYKPADVTRTLKDTSDIIKTQNSLKGKVYQEIFEDARGKGGREINYFEK